MLVVWMPLVKDSLLAPLPQEGLHPLHPGRRVPTFPVPLELVYVLPKHIPRPQGGDQVIKLSLVLSVPWDEILCY